RITGGDTYESAISSTEDVRLTDVVVEQNFGDNLVIYSSKLTIERSRIVNNTARESMAGAAVLSSRSLIIRSSQISDNIGPGVGANGSDVYISDTIISNNAGTGLSFWAQQAQIVRTTLSDNFGAVGGLNYMGGSNLLISECSFVRNAGGGALFGGTKGTI